MQLTASRTDLQQILAEDAPYGDLTTEALGIGDRPGVMTFAARDPMVLAEAESAALMLTMAGCTVSLKAHSGDALEPATNILVARGSAASLHRAWKVAQTLIETWSGVASATRAIVEAARARCPQIAVACTRKTTPGTKSFAVRAVRAGGATMHRLGLSETVLVFPEHRIFLSDGALAKAVQHLRATAPEKTLVIEVTSVEDAQAAAAAGFDVVQAEKFTPGEVASMHRALRKHGNIGQKQPLIAAAGGINVDNAAEYAEAGADVLVTSAPYLARPRDVQVTFESRSR
jgi:molybdenum transport protein